MQSDYEGTINLDQMDDGDVRELVRQRLDEDDGFDVDTVEVGVDGGKVTVEGRVGTEGERQRVDQVLGALGAREYANNVVVDEAVRAQRAEAADTARAEDAAADAALGEAGETTSDTAQHLQPDPAGDLYGTSDVQEAIQEGRPYSPPDGPIQEGVEGDERH